MERRGRAMAHLGREKRERVREERLIIEISIITAMGSSNSHVANPTHPNRIRKSPVQASLVL